VAAPALQTPALGGLRVLDLTRLLPGGYCTMILADLGADVIKVEDVGLGDYMRWVPPFHAGVERSAASAAFAALNRGKRSVRLDLKQREGRDAFLALARDADVLVESFRPGVMDRLGLGYATVSAENERLVYCSISGYGQDGPDRERAGHDLNYVGLTGLLDMTGEDGGPPVQAAAQLADIGGGGQLAAIAILGAALASATTGHGRYLDVSMTRGAAAWTALAAAAHLCDGTRPERGRIPLAGAMVCYRPYRCADGWVTLGAVEEKFWAAFCRGLGREDLLACQHDPPGSPAHTELSQLFLRRTREEWTAFGRRHDCCLEPVLSLDEALAAPELEALVVDVPQPGAVHDVRVLGPAVRMAGAAAPDATVPSLGEHTTRVLSEAGLEPDRIDGLLAARAAAGVEPAGEHVFRI
jgi:alpha-methylacyl-CoA racemase